jgi:hypothetical protein
VTSPEVNTNTGHSDAELARPGLLSDERLAQIIREFLSRWAAYPTIPGSRRWEVNGLTALRELERRLAS